MICLGYLEISFLWVGGIFFGGRVQSHNNPPAMPSSSASIKKKNVRPKKSPSGGHEATVSMPSSTAKRRKIAPIPRKILRMF